MRTITKTLVILASLSLAAGADAQSARVRLLATGGTIAGAQAKPGEYGYKSGTFNVQDLISAVPNLDKLAVITGEQVVNIGSQDMNDEVWLKLAGRLNAALNSPDVNGVVITHGTDTLEETSYFLSLVTHSDKPVVMVGSMRPATAVSADGPGNLYNAVALLPARAPAGGACWSSSTTRSITRETFRRPTPAACRHSPASIAGRPGW